MEDVNSSCCSSHFSFLFFTFPRYKIEFYVILYIIIFKNINRKRDFGNARYRGGKQGRRQEVLASTSGAPTNEKPKGKKGGKQNCRLRGIPRLKTPFCVFFEN